MRSGVVAVVLIGCNAAPKTNAPTNAPASAVASPAIAKPDAMPADAAPCIAKALMNAEIKAFHASPPMVACYGENAAQACFDVVTEGLVARRGPAPEVEQPIQFELSSEANGIRACHASECVHLDTKLAPFEGSHYESAADRDGRMIVVLGRLRSNIGLETFDLASRKRRAHVDLGKLGKNSIHDATIVRASNVRGDFVVVGEYPAAPGGRVVALDTRIKRAIQLYNDGYDVEVVTVDDHHLAVIDPTHVWFADLATMTVDPPIAVAVKADDPGRWIAGAVIDGRVAVVHASPPGMMWIDVNTRKVSEVPLRVCP